MKILHYTNDHIVRIGDIKLTKISYVEQSALLGTQRSFCLKISIDTDIVPSKKIIYNLFFHPESWKLDVNTSLMITIVILTRSNQALRTRTRGDQ